MKVLNQGISIYLFYNVSIRPVVHPNLLGRYLNACNEIDNHNRMRQSDEMAAGVDYCGPLQMIDKGFCLATLENLMKYWPGGSYLDMKSTPRIPGGRPLLAIGYKYNSRKVLGFIATEGDESTEPGDLYLSFL